MTSNEIMRTLHAAYIVVRSGAPNRHIILIDMFLVSRQCYFKLVKLEEQEDTNIVIFREYTYSELPFISKVCQISRVIYMHGPGDARYSVSSGLHKWPAATLSGST